MARQEKQNNERGIGIKPEERTESQQQKCVSASATVGVLLRYICKHDEANERQRKRNEILFGYGGDVVSAEQQAR